MLDNILNSLDKVRKNGKNYTAICPVHQDTKPSMTITETQKGDVLIHCFSCGAKGTDVVRALGLPVGELFADELKIEKSRPYYNKELKVKDKYIIEFYERDGGGYKDYKAYQKSKTRMTTFNERMREWMQSSN